jgi:AraC-like DNA-binding protein
VLHGARLRTGAALRLLDCTAADLLDTIVPLDDVLRAPLRTTAMDGGSAANAGRSLRPLDAAGSLHGAVTDWLRRTARSDGSADATVRSAIKWLGTNWRSSVDDLSRQVNWSDRKLRRRFVATVGMGPKLVQRIVRVQHTLQLMRARTGDISLSDLAAECGFADQAHMTREVAHFTNHTPHGLRRLARPRIWMTA